MRDASFWMHLLFSIFCFRNFILSAIFNFSFFLALSWTCSLSFSIDNTLWKFTLSHNALPYYLISRIAHSHSNLRYSSKLFRDYILFIINLTKVKFLLKMFIGTVLDWIWFTKNLTMIKFSFHLQKELNYGNLNYIIIKFHFKITWLRLSSLLESLFGSDIGGLGKNRVR